MDKRGRNIGDGILGGYVAQANRHLSLRLTDAVPRYALKGPAALSGVRKQGYTYYTRQFSELLFIVDVRPEIKGRPRAARGESLGSFSASGAQTRSCFRRATASYLDYWRTYVQVSP